MQHFIWMMQDFMTIKWEKHKHAKQTFTMKCLLTLYFAHVAFGTFWRTQKASWWLQLVFAFILNYFQCRLILYAATAATEKTLRILRCVTTDPTFLNFICCLHGYGSILIWIDHTFSAWVIVTRHFTENKASILIGKQFRQEFYWENT